MPPLISTLSFVLPGSPINPLLRAWKVRWFSGPKVRLFETTDTDELVRRSPGGRTGKLPPAKTAFVSLDATSGWIGADQK
jgi:hypothetical protein